MAVVFDAAFHSERIGCPSKEASSRYGAKRELRVEFHLARLVTKDVVRFALVRC